MASHRLGRALAHGVTATLLSGALLTSSGWAALNWLVFPAVALILVPLIWRIRRGTTSAPAAV